MKNNQPLQGERHPEHRPDCASAPATEAHLDDISTVPLTAPPRSARPWGPATTPRHRIVGLRSPAAARDSAISTIDGKAMPNSPMM